jgi:CubicO group peptidase (beta-lactamase class C family)
MRCRPALLNVLLLSTCVVTAASTAIADDQHEKKIALVEQGLRPAHFFEGDTAWTLEDRMEHYGVPGVSIAVIDDYQVAWFRVYGLADRVTGEPVRPDTLFQAGSVSKPVAALGALKLVEMGKLSLDEPVNEKLRTWKIPDNEFTKDAPVTLTHLASHTGGLTVHGFPGYAAGEEVPALVQVLDGSGPANTDPIRVDRRPGEGWRYSGGGYTVMQQAMIDAGGKPFPELMRDLVFGPTGVTRSTFAQPLPPDLLKKAAAGVLPDGSDVPGKRHVYPEMAAAGLWTNAEDLARVAVEVQNALRGRGQVLTKATAEHMLTEVDSGYGLGFGLQERGGGLYFQHGGWGEGFCAQLTAHRDASDGVAIPINSNHPGFLDELVRSVGVTYGWDGYGVLVKQPIPETAWKRYPGRYRYNSELSFRIFQDDDHLFMQYDGSEPQELMHTGGNIHVRRERSGRITFTEQDEGLAFQFLLGGDDRQTHVRMKEDERAPRQLLA